ncbi:MAG: histidine phosphatase family protein [Actinobacteria bacterium]|nr:histidine phosphatase family protein [Actinomycetota bacterium]
MIVFVRHGETTPNRQGLLLGRADPALTDRGRRQADELAEWIGAWEPVAVLASPLARARETAAPIAAAVGCDVEIDDRLIEIDYGEWEARPFAELPPDVVARWRDDADFAPPGGESLRVVGKRVAAFCEERLDQRVTVAVSHVSPIKAAVTWGLGVGDELAWRMRLDVASVTRIGPGPALLSFNESRGSLHP